MRSYPDLKDKYDKEEVARLAPKPWMLDCLRLNPGYVSWGPHEDYMWNEKEGWNSRIIAPTWGEFEIKKLDELNEVVHFYFSIGRDQKDCETCNATGYHPDALWVSESFYRHSSPFAPMDVGIMQSREIMSSFGGGRPKEDPLGRRAFPDESVLKKYGAEFRAFCEEMRTHGEWVNRITQDEADALQKSHRVASKWNPETKKQEKIGRADPVAINAENGPGHRGMGHDAINRGILIEARLKRFGIPQTCPTCDGQGSVFTAPESHLSLTLWVLHPRKGCSRGVEVTRLNEGELPEVFKYLRTAAARNADRFSKIPAAPKKKPRKP